MAYYSEIAMIEPKRNIDHPQTDPYGFQAEHHVIDSAMLSQHVQPALRVWGVDYESRQGYKVCVIMAPCDAGGCLAIWNSPASRDPLSGRMSVRKGRIQMRKNLTLCIFTLLLAFGSIAPGSTSSEPPALGKRRQAPQGHPAHGRQCHRGGD